jgi:ankyrin repeat protein
MRNTIVAVAIMLLPLCLYSCSPPKSEVHEAAYSGDITKVKAYVEAGGQLDTLDPWERTIIGNALAGGQVAVIKYLLSKGIDEKEWHNGRAFIHQATESNQVEAVRFLVERGADVNSRTLGDPVLGDKGQTPLLLAAQELDYPVATYLISKGAQVNAQDEYSNTPLITAIFLSHGEHSNPAKIFQFVKLLVEHGADINQADKKGSTPLALAALTEHKEVVDYLVQKGADINKRGENGETAFSYAAGEANKSLCEYFIRLGARPNDRLDDGSTVLMQALRSDNMEFLRWLIPKYSYNIQDRDTSGQTLLMYAVNKSLATTRFVVNDLKMDVNASDASGVTPLILAARNLELDKRGSARVRTEIPVRAVGRAVLPNW